MRRSSHRKQDRITDSLRNLAGYNVFFPAAFTFAHLALAIAASLALTAGLIRRSAFLAGFGVARVALTLAHRALAAAAIFARAEADMRRFFGPFPAKGEEAPRPATRELSWPCNLSIRSLMAMIWLSWPTVKSVRLVMDYW
jgi:hypothetical protein